MPARSRRTLQYAPAVIPEKVESAARSAADGMILDLESTVDESDKNEARANLGPFLRDIDFGGKEVIIRINGFDSDRWLGDLRAAIDAGVDTIRLPKIEEPWEVRTAVETANQLAEAAPEFLIQLESPQGVQNGEAIATTCEELPQVTGIGVGIGDYTTALGRESHTPELQNYLLNVTGAYASIGNMDPLAYVHKDLDTLRSAAERAKALGHVGQPVPHAADTEEFVAVLHEVYGV